MLRTIIKKYSPIDTIEKVDSIVTLLLSTKYAYKDYVEETILCDIQDAEIQNYFKRAWKILKPDTKKPLRKRKSYIGYVHIPKRKENKTSVHTIEHKKNEQTSISHNKNKRVKATKGAIERREERFERNRDKRVERGYSSTGVRLPSITAGNKNVMKSRKKRNSFRLIYTPIGGQNKKY